MATSTNKEIYSVWAIPPEDVCDRLTSLMTTLGSEFRGPHFEPHMTVVGAIELTPDDALNKLRSASEGVKAFQVTVDRVATGTFFYQCVYLLLHPTPQVFFLRFLLFLYLCKFVTEKGLNRLCSFCDVNFVSVILLADSGNQCTLLQPFWLYEFNS